MFEQKSYSHTAGKQRVKIPQKHPGNMYAYTMGGSKKKRRVMKKGK